MTTRPPRNSISLSPLQRTWLLFPLVCTCFALSPAPKAFGVSPAPDGGYPGYNTAEGTQALLSLSTGIHNTALGGGALRFDTTGSHNTATGSSTLVYNNGHDNTATGFRALYYNTSGGDNTASGSDALTHNTIGNYNTANGFDALFSNTTGNDNVATGFQALYSNKTGDYNTANGYGALFKNTDGIYNTANGYVALYSNTGDFNTANGYGALYPNTTGGLNTANGSLALSHNTTGNQNTANGYEALFYNTTGSNNIALGYRAGYALTTGDYNIDIGNYGMSLEANTIRIGDSIYQHATFIAGIFGQSVGGNEMTVIVDNNGKLGTPTSSRRFKKEIKPMDQTSEAILGLKPVTFQYKSDPTGAAQFGLIAEEVAEVNPDLVVRDPEGEIYSVRYEAVNAMLLNEFLKEHRKVQEQETAISRLRSTVAKQEVTATLQQKEIQKLTASLKEQGALIQNVSAELALRESASQTAFNNK